MLDLSSLNSNQLESVNWTEGPLLVLAGPGSGKTRVLTSRIARIIEETLGKRFRILGLTFTNKAASEMRQRIESLVPNARERTLLTTFHSFSVDLLRQHGHHIGLRPDFTILSQPVDRESVLDEAIEITRSDYPDITYRSEQLLPLVTRLLDNCVSPDSAIGALQQGNVNGAHALGTIYKNYRRLMVENNQLDFGGLVAEALGLLEEKPAIRRLVCRIYPYVCVDEFQDTNLAQYKILCNIVNPETKNLFVVADDDQIIYQWNGADPERLRSLHQDFGMAALQLPENYRCPPDVVEVANKLIGHNLSRDFKKSAQIANKKETAGGVIRVESFDSFDDEVEWVASDIASRSVGARGDCVVLARTRRLLEPVLVALEGNGVPAYLAMRKDEFVSYPMIWLHSTLRLANARQDREQLRRICKSFFELSGINLIVGDIISEAAPEEGDYLRAWARVALRREQLDPYTRRFLTASVPKLSDRLDIWGFIADSFAWFEKLPEVGPVSGDDVSEFTEEKDTWRDLVNEVIGEFGREQVTLNVLLQGLDLRSKAPIPTRGAVPCFTIHASKGMEFRHVYLAGLVEEQLPSWSALKKGDASLEMQEERRNCFVAITRVQESLTLTFSEEVFGWHKRPSRFLEEMELVWCTRSSSHYSEAF